ncbi:MAG: hypothetical protein IT198_12180 [Acidimicrobiia bacterium]|nr:hypothetical protein [Acidimicrobiia bacterium]
MIAALFVAGGTAQAATADADGDGIPFGFDPDGDVTHYVRPVEKLTIDGEYDIVSPEDLPTVKALVQGSVTTIAGRPFGTFTIKGTHANGYAPHLRWALVLGSGIAAGADQEIYLAPTVQLCFDAGNFFQWSFCRDRYLIGRGSPGADFRVGSNSDDTKFATGDWQQGNMTVTLK